MDIGVWTRSLAGSNNQPDTRNLSHENHYICPDSKNYPEKMEIVKTTVDIGANRHE